VPANPDLLPGHTVAPYEGHGKQEGPEMRWNGSSAQTTKLVFRPPILDCHVLAVAVPAFVQPLAECRGISAGSPVQIRYPMTGSFVCCAPAASGHAAPPPSSAMNSRRFIRSPRRRGRVAYLHYRRMWYSRWSERRRGKIMGVSFAAKLRRGSIPTCLAARSRCAPWRCVCVPSQSTGSGHRKCGNAIGRGRRCTDATRSFSGHFWDRAF
jgi:hypothetical protein